MPMMTMLVWRGAKAFRAAASVLSALLVAVTLAGLPQFLLVTPAAAAPDEPESITNARLWIYPEFDDPRLLVMLQGTVPDSTKLPTSVRFLVPAGAEMYSAGSIDKNNNYSGGPPDRAPSGVEGWDIISYTLTTNVFRMEYYDDNIKGLPDKTIAYEFRTLYPIVSLEVEALQPLKAANFSITPPSQGKSVVEGMNAFTYRFSGVSVDNPLDFNIAYAKSDNVPSVKPQGGAATTTQPSSPDLTWVLGIVGAAVIAGAAIYLTNNRRRYRPAPARVSRVEQRSRTAQRPVASGTQRASRGERPVQRASERAGFCRKCGAKIQGTAKFCSRCGTRLE